MSEAHPSSLSLTPAEGSTTAPSNHLQSDTDRLIAALQLGFQDLVKKQEEHSKSQKEQAERLHKAVEALKTQAPVTDKKTAFWNSYMKLADEHDKEFKEKYSTDLDTALIFAGLFSAVSSAFIIQIQQQLSPHSATIIVIVQSLLYTSLFTTLLAALLAILGKQWIMYFQAAGSRGTIEERGLERQHVPPAAAACVATVLQCSVHGPSTSQSRSLSWS
ncbi:hypothetical protein C8R44DRAFT_973842 [Mycena epipterygia]|nr:hypothetical protein C8R44DRAFT_973842 [Mycena epipterygia]